MSYGMNIAGASARQRYRANAVTFNPNTGSYLFRSSAPIGAVDSSKFIFALSLKLNSLPVDAHHIFGLISMEGGNGALEVAVLEDGTLRVLGYNGFTNILQVTSSVALTVGQRNGILIACDFSSPSNRGVNINGTIDGSAAWAAYVNGALSFSAGGVADSPVFIGNLNGDIDKNVDGVVADVYLNTVEYTNPALNYSKFFDASNRPVYKGSDGSRPTGNPPAIFLPDMVVMLGSNIGTGGDFIANGTFVDVGKI